MAARSVRELLEEAAGGQPRSHLDFAALEHAGRRRRTLATAAASLAVALFIGIVAVTLHSLVTAPSRVELAPAAPIAGENPGGPPATAGAPLVAAQLWLTLGLGALVGVALLACFAAWDMQTRGRRGWMFGLLVLFLPVVGVPLWRVQRRRAGPRCVPAGPQFTWFAALVIVAVAGSGSWLTHPGALSEPGGGTGVSARPVGVPVYIDTRVWAKRDVELIRVRARGAPAEAHVTFHVCQRRPDRGGFISADEEELLEFCQRVFAAEGATLRDWDDTFLLARIVPTARTGFLINRFVVTYRDGIRIGTQVSGVEHAFATVGAQRPEW